jgi:hypothetical protein
MLTKTLPGTDHIAASSDEHQLAKEEVTVMSRVSVTDRLIRRKWPVVLTAVFIATGMAFMFAWNPLVHHVNNWATGGDVWGIYRGAQYVSWGDLGGIYNQGNGVVAFPGMEVLLVPVALVSDHFHLVASFGPFMLPRPTVAPLLMPVELLLASSVLFAADALAERLGVAARRRAWLCLSVAVVAWPTTALWGHAEDALAMTFALYAMVALLNRRWPLMGWLFGIGVVMQPLVVLLLPVFLGTTPRGQRFLLAVRSLALSAFLVLVAFAGDASDAYRSLVEQPTPPSINHATPWSHLSPVVSSKAVQTIHGAGLVPAADGSGHFSMHSATATGQAVVQVSGGAGRMIDVVLAILIGLYVWRRPQSPVRVLWLAAVVLVSRCFFEPVMTPYYLAPPLFLCLVLASRQRGKRFWSSVVIAFEITVFAYHHLNPWVWWVPIVAGLVAILALTYPGHENTERTDPDETDSDGAVTDADGHRVGELVDSPTEHQPALL